MPHLDSIESTLIWYKGTDHKDYRQWTDALDQFLASMYDFWSNLAKCISHNEFQDNAYILIFTVYKTPGVTTGRGQNIFNCKYNQPPPPGKVCDVDIREFKKCTHENNYSYHKSSPCVFIKLNRIYGWVPTFYNRTDDLPRKMPKQLKHRIINETDPMEVRKANLFPKIKCQ